MKVIKKRHGYTIQCTDGDYQMLDALVDSVPFDARRRICKGAAKTALTRRQKGRGDGSLLAVDEDRGAQPLSAAHERSIQAMQDANR